eukprot:4081469-Prymnesium_polylepis.1
MRHLYPACIESVKKAEIVARPRSAHIACDTTGVHSAKTPPPRGNPGGRDDPSDPNEPAHRSGAGHHCGGRACRDIAPPHGRASHIPLSTAAHPHASYTPRHAATRPSRHRRLQLGRPA